MHHPSIQAIYKVRSDEQFGFSTVNIREKKYSGNLRDSDRTSVMNQ